MATGKRSRLRSWLSLVSPINDGQLQRNALGQMVEEPIASPSISLGGHFVLGFAFSAAVILYFVFALVFYLTAPLKETYIQVPMTTLTLPKVQVSVECTNVPNCGAMALVVNYSDVTTCSGKVADQTYTWTNSSIGPITVELCGHTDYPYSILDAGAPQIPGVFVDFSNINPGEDQTGTKPYPVDLSRKAIGVVTVTSGVEGEEGYMKKVVIQDQHQVKTLVLGRSLTKTQDLTVTDDALLPSAVQYEGKRRDGRSTLFIRLDHFATVRKTFREGSIVEVLAGVGGASSLVTTILLLLGPLVALFLPGQATEADGVGKATEDELTVIQAVAAGGTASAVPSPLNQTSPRDDGEAQTPQPPQEEATKESTA